MSEEESRQRADASISADDALARASAINEDAGAGAEGQSLAHEAAFRLLSAGDFRAAAELYAALSAQGVADINASLGLGSALLGLGKYEAAERELRRAHQLAPDRADVHLHLGTALYKRGVYTAAAMELRRAAELDPDCSQAFLLLGEALNQMGKPDAAIEVLERVTHTEVGSRALYALGIAYDRKGEPERASEMYRQSRELSAR